MPARPPPSRKRNPDPEVAHRLALPLRTYAEAGGSIAALSELSEVPERTLRGWLAKGVPQVAIDYDRVMSCLSAPRRRAPKA